MNATELSPSRSIESSLLSYSNTPASPSAFPHSPRQTPNHETQNPPTSSDSDTSALPPPDPDVMDHQPTPPPVDVEEPPPPPPPADEETDPAVEGQDHDRMTLDSDATGNQPQQRESAEAQPATLPEPPSLPLPSALNTSRLLDLLDEPPPPLPPQFIPPPQVLVAVQSNPNPPAPPGDPNNPTGQNVDVLARERSATESSTDNTQEGDDDSDDDDYDGHMDFLDRFKEDKSEPNEEEMREIEASSEKNALDHDHWEKAVFTALDDPEYVPGESGIISWTLQDFHGTKQNPNKKRIMRSPVVSIGGYRWNIKVFPHGNEGTDQISVYVECSGEGAAPENDNSDEMQATPTHNENSAEESTTESKAPQEPPVEYQADLSKPWDVAAQIGCVMYNPDEPRVCVFEKATHHFEDASQDWGWVRFHGPWNGIHQRRPLQRRPILQNDTLSFTAFIRVVSDPTKALWWRPADQSSWDSIAKTGYRGLSADEPASYSFVASLAPWLHLKQFRELVLGMAIPDSVRDPLRRTRPLFEQLQEVLYKKHSPKGSSNAVSLFQLQQAFDWHEHSFVNSSDVVELWESFRNILNIEYYGQDPTEHGPDILDFVWTIRQNLHPVLPAVKDQPTDSKEPHSVQEVLNETTQDGNVSCKDWEGWSYRGKTPPSVLQVELHRQKYDTQARKWKKMTHKIKLDDSVVFNEVRFTLFSIIIHKGELGSGRFYSIVRPGGPSSRWIRYKSGVTSYLTHRQAVESHEGKGDERYGSESVAYVAIYVQSDRIGELAPVSEEKSPSGVLGPLLRKEKKPHDLSKTDSIPVVVHSSEHFKERKSTGLLDVWSPNNGGGYQLSMSPSNTLHDVQVDLATKFRAAAKPEQCRLWPMKTTANTIRFLPPFEQFVAPETKLLDFAERMGGIHLWLHVIPEELIVEHVVPSPPLEPVQDSHSSTVDIPLPPQADTTATAIQTSESPDVVMGGTQEQPSEPGPAGDRLPEPPSDIPVAPGPEVYVPEPPRDKQWQLQDQLYILFKKFDPESQTLTGIGGFFLSPNERISNVVPQLVQVSSPFKAYHEIDTVLDEPELVPDATFSTACLLNGSIVIVQPDNLSEARTEELRQRGDALTVPEFFQTQTFLSHFSYQGPEHVASYFGGPYTRAPLRNGRFFGPCTMIDDSTGDAYVGNCTGGYKSGKGVMYYANGDTYTGDWAHSLPEGQGTMVYHTTGNTYVGGWKGGRRHGKGVMNFEVADEELQLCRICYENEMDALFYRCGHVAACEMCARQVRDCPVCRRPVDAVVRIWRT